VLATMGCASGERDLVPACVGPSLELCESTSTSADCGGDLAPVFGCDDTRCRWFVGGCVAEGFVSSRCESGALCCERGSSGAHAVYGLQTDSSVAVRAAAFVVDHGPTSIGLDEGFALDVTSSGDAAPVESSIVCDDARHHPALCERPGSTLVLTSSGESDLRLLYADAPATGVEIERRIVDGVEKARVCAVSDLQSSPDCPSYLPDETHCATSGTVAVGAGFVVANVMLEGDSVSIAVHLP